jgi:flavin-dependent dehydrogenase
MVAYMTDADLYAAGRTGSGSFLADQLKKAPYIRETIETTPARVGSFSAATMVRDSAVRRNWIAVGDAAQSYDPLYGAGLWNVISMARRCVPVTMRLLDGEGGAAADYQTYHREAFARYRTAHTAYYVLERRWLESEFWRRRPISIRPISIPSQPSWHRESL